MPSSLETSPLETSPLEIDRLYRSCLADRFPFRDTGELERIGLLTPHRRAAKALGFGTSIDSSGFNLYVLGDPGSGKHQMVREYLEQRAAGATVPPDWCYVFNFDEPSHPRCLQLPPGRGRMLRDDLTELVDELRTAIPAVFESEEYQSRIQELEQAMQRKQRDGLDAVRDEAREQGIMMLTTPAGFTFAPAKGDDIMDMEEFRKLPEEERQRLERIIQELQKHLQQSIQQVPRLTRELRKQIAALNEEMLLTVISGPFRELSDKHKDQAQVLEHLEAVRKFLIEHVNVFRQNEPDIPPEAILSRCQINLLVDNAGRDGAPVVYQDLATHQHLVGRIEHHVRDGALLTDFSLIRAGALHLANGGYLLLDARNVLMQPGAWETLKRVLRAGKIRTESLEQAYGLISTVSLEPEAIPLDLKIVLVGERMLYYMLTQHDPEFAELFKVQVDLEDVFERDEENELAFARLLATLVDQAGVRHLSPEGVAAMIEQASRLAEDQGKLSAASQAIEDLLREADYWAVRGHSDLIQRSQVEKAVHEQIYRSERLRESSMEYIRRGTVLIATTGEAVAQVNGLSVLQVGNFLFGRPARITATARPGRGQVIDIEREAKLGGPLHTKAVMILSRFLANRYAPDEELSLSASLAFEQSYGGIEGDSASVAEVCALVSAIARLPLQQKFAVTGSINQHGEVQAVGGVNEKVEGFFRVCLDAGGCNGQGVLLPEANVRNLMLASEVREAVRAGQFHIYAISTVDQALELLSGRTVGEQDDAGNWTTDSINDRVVQRLRRFTSKIRKNGDRDGEVEG